MPAPAPFGGRRFCFLPRPRGPRVFDFSGFMERLVRHIVRHTADLAHIDCDRLVFGVTQQRRFGSTGLFAKVIPLRFEEGRFSTRAHGAHWAVPRYTHHGREVLYIVAFCLPRFLNMPYERKGETIFHELYHISPAFNGDLRRFPGKYYQHGPDARKYDAHVLRLFQAYEHLAGAQPILTRLRSRFHHIEHRFGSVTGLFARTPEPIRVDSADAQLPLTELHVRRRPLLSHQARARCRA